MRASLALNQPKEARIDWSRPGGEIYNLIRGSDPQPGANSTLDGETVSFYDASFAPGDSTDAGGSVVSVGEQIGIAVLDGTISVGRVRGADGKVPAADFVEATGLKAGDRFGD